MSTVVQVTPKNTAVFTAIRLESNDSVPDIETMLADVGGRIQGWTLTQRRGKQVEVLRVFSRSRHKYDLAVGDWLVFLGTNGSLRVCTDREFNTLYALTESGI